MLESGGEMPSPRSGSVSGSSRLKQGRRRRRLLKRKRKAQRRKKRQLERQNELMEKVLYGEPELDAVEEAHVCAVCLDLLHEPHATK